MQSNTVLFSIVIPTYNRVADLDRCLTSLVAQTFKNFEVIVCDNGSSDDIKSVVTRFSEKLNINYIFLEINSGGPARPRNLGARAAKGDWICFLDSDDWYIENRLEYISVLDLDTFDFLYHDLNIIKNGEPYKKMRGRHLSITDTYTDYVQNINFIPTSSTCIRNTFLQQTDGFSESTDISGLEDFDLWLRLAHIGTRFKYVPTALGFYAVGNDNFTYHDERQINRFNALYLPLIAKNPNNQKIKSVLDYQIACINLKRRKFGVANQALLSVVLYGSGQLKKKAFSRFLIGMAYLFKLVK